MPKKIKLGTVAGKMNGAGVESIVMSYMRHLNQELLELTLIVDNDSKLLPMKELSDLGVEVVQIPPYQKIHSYHQELYQLFREKRFDIVHAHINTLNVFPLFAAWRAGIPVRIAHNHNTAGKGKTKRNILKYMLRPFAKVFPTVLTACSKSAGKWIYGKRAEFFIMPNSIDFESERYCFDPSVRAVKRCQLRLDNKLVIGHVGRFNTQKNHFFFPQCFYFEWKCNSPGLSPASPPNHLSRKVHIPTS